MCPAAALLKIGVLVHAPSVPHGLPKTALVGADGIEPPTAGV